MNNTNLPEIIQKQGLPVLKNNQDLHAMVHQVFTPDKFNVLVPMAMNISPKVKVAIQLVELDGNPDLKANRSFWSIDGKECILSAKAIRALSTAANVQWIPAETGISGTPEYDASGQILRLRYRAVGQVLTSIGTMRLGTGEYEYNYANDKNNSSLKPNQVMQRRRFALQLAETGAKNRAFFDALGMVEKSYPVKDIGKPFVVPCVIDDIDYEDPVVKKLIAQRAIGATGEVYGKSAVEADYEVVPEETKEPAAEQAQTAQATASEPPPIVEEAPDDGAMKRAAYKKDIEQMTPADRAANIIDLAGKTQTAVPKRNSATQQPVAPPDKCEKNTQISWLMHLAEKAGIIPPEKRLV